MEEVFAKAGANGRRLSRFLGDNPELGFRVKVVLTGRAVETRDEAATVLTNNLEAVINDLLDHGALIQLAHDKARERDRDMHELALKAINDQRKAAGLPELVPVEAPAQPSAEVKPIGSGKRKAAGG